MLWDYLENMEARMFFIFAMPTKNPIVYGGRKSPNQMPYTLLKIYDLNCNIITHFFLKFYNLYTVKGRKIEINENLSKYIPRILSIFIANRETFDLKMNNNKIIDLISRKNNIT